DVENVEDGSDKNSIDKENCNSNTIATITEQENSSHSYSHVARANASTSSLPNDSNHVVSSSALDASKMKSSSTKTILSKDYPEDMSIPYKDETDVSLTIDLNEEKQLVVDPDTFYRNILYTGMNGRFDPLPRTDYCVTVRNIRPLRKIYLMFPDGNISSSFWTCWR
ncbi:hypothetical protein FBU30_010281, partial [Linnemannia zychae]